MLRKLALALLAAAPLAVPVTGHAQGQVEAFSKCLADNTSGKDRKDLARWVFLAMAAHPEIKQYAAANAAQATDESNKVLAAMFTRLLTESCLKEFRGAMKEGGATGIQAAFQTLGQLAWGELVTDRSVTEAMSAFEKHIDQQKINKAVVGQ